MEYLAPEHQDIAIQGLDKLRAKLPSVQEDIFERLKAEEWSFPRSFKLAQENMKRNLPTASVLWEYMLDKAENKQQKFAILNKLFQVQIATGPWKAALETAQKLFDETSAENSSENANRQTANDRGLDSLLTAPLLFNACLNLGTIHRLLKELSKAEQLYSKALEIAMSVKDSDKEIIAKIHLAICLLDRGELKEAISSYFEPLMGFKTAMKKDTRSLYLRYYGGACRSAADWGRAKDYLREALDFANEMKDSGLVSSCCGELGNVFRSEGRYKEAETLHTFHQNVALSRGDIHGLAIACGNIGFLNFYNPEKFDDSVVYQFIEYSLAEQVGDFARTGIAFNKIGKLYTTLGYNEEAVAMFQIALDVSRRASNVAGEGMAWGNLGTVYRALERFEDAIACHIKYRDNAERRMDIGGVAIMQHQLALDYLLSGKLSEAERSILNAFETLEKIRAQIGEEDKSKLSNFEKNQAEAYNLLQVVLVAQLKYKEALVLADTSRGRALAEIVRKRLQGDNSADKETITLNEEFIEESFNNLLQVSRKLSTTLVFYSVVKEFEESGACYNWVYAWVLHSSGRLDFSKSRLKHGIRDTKVEVNDEFVVSLRRSMGQPSQIKDLGEILRGKMYPNVSREAKVHVETLQSEDVMNSLEGLEHMFASGLILTNAENGNNISFDIPYKTKENGLCDQPSLQSVLTSEESNTHVDKRFNLEPESTNQSATCPLGKTTTEKSGATTEETYLENNEKNSLTETREDQDKDLSGASICESLNQSGLKEESAISKAKSNESPQLSETQQKARPKHSEGIFSQLETANSETSPTPLQGEIQTEVEKNSVTSSSDFSETACKENSSEVEKDELAIVPGPFNGVVSEPLGTHSREQDKRESDPELDPWRPMLSELHKVLIEPIVQFLPPRDGNPRVTFIPQDFLLKVPFAALQGDARDNYIMEDFVISTSPAIHFLELACASRESPEHNTAPFELSLLAVGNPTMPFEELPQLPSAQREVRMIKEIINSSESQVFTGSRAKKNDVMTAMPKHKLLHFATHAIIDDIDSHGDFSMKGRIVLAKSGLECNGILTAEEVRGMELNAELVVLSCCDTGLGKVTGDGVLGLSRAFLAAGAACVIVTLWKIDDRSACELMTSFYREYMASRDAAASLQQAMKTLQAKENTRSPQHWAAFSIVGVTGV